MFSCSTASITNHAKCFSGSQSLGDGGSSSGAHQFDGHVLDAAKRLYARHGVRIHTVLVTDSTRHEKLMNDLAAATGGRMVKPRAGAD